MRSEKLKVRDGRWAWMWEIGRAGPAFWRKPEQCFWNGMNRLPCVLDRIRRDAVRERQWVHPPTTALIDPFFEKHGILVGRQRMICRDHNGLRPRLHEAHLIGRCVRKFQSLHRSSS